MAYGQQFAEQNLRTFLAWAAGKSHTEFRVMVSRGVLSRKEIAKECGFAQSAQNQNPRIKAALKAAEDNIQNFQTTELLQQQAAQSQAQTTRL